VTRIPLRAGLAALAAGTLLAAAGSVSASSTVYVSFRTPSGNIGCGYAKFAGETANLRCEIVSGIRPLPAKPRGCTEGVWGRAVGMAPTGRATGYCITDTVMEPGAPVLAYGRTWTRGSFTCASKASGLTCRNRDGHGWLLSRTRSRIF
jgi:hypothetical protein